MKTLVIAIVMGIVICEMSAQSNMRQIVYDGYRSLLMRRNCKLCKDQSRFAWLCPTLINRCGQPFIKASCPLSCKLCKPCAELDALESGAAGNQVTGTAAGPENDGIQDGEAEGAGQVSSFFGEEGGANSVSFQTVGYPGAQASCSQSE